MYFLYGLLDVFGVHVYRKFVYTYKCKCNLVHESNVWRMSKDREWESFNNKIYLQPFNIRERIMYVWTKQDMEKAILEYIRFYFYVIFVFSILAKFWQNLLPGW